MTFREFKAWLEGYEVSFAMQRSPNAEEWQIIKEKLETVFEPAYNNPPVVYNPPIHLWRPVDGTGINQPYVVSSKSG